MRRLLAIIVTLVLGSFSPAFADLIVMDRDYYYTLYNTHVAQCGILYTAINDFRQNADVRLADIGESINQVKGQCQTMSSLYSTIGDVYPATAVYARQGVSTANSAINTLQLAYDNIQTLRTDVTDNSTTWLNQIHVISNSFPVQVSSTNLNIEIYVVVTNDFSCTNALQDVHTDYTNFLNYYESAGNDVLNQYRLTVTNLLDWSQFPNWVDYTRWKWGSKISTPVEGFYNIAWDSVGWDLSAAGYPFYQGASNVRYWRYYQYRLPSDPSFSDFLIFSLQGLHDSVEHISKIMHSDYYGLFSTASTNSVMTYTFSNSQTNAMEQFLLSESNYEKQVHKIARSRNLYQRFEHWLSYIARSVSKDDVEINEDGTRTQDLETMANDALEQAESISNEFAIVQQRTSSTLAVMTNTWSSIANLLSPFVPEDKPSRTLRAANDDPGIKIMSTQFVGDRLRDLTKKGNDVPNSLILSDTVFNDALGNEAQKIEVVGKMSKLKEICHTTFGIIWILLFFTIAFFECFYFMKTAINLWWKALRFIPDVSRYMFGN